MFSSFANPFTGETAGNELSEPEKHTPPNVRPRTYNEALISYLERHPSTTDEDIETIKKEGGDLECLFLWGASEQDIADAEIIAKGPTNNDPNRNPLSPNNPNNSSNSANNSNPNSSSSNRPPEAAGEAPSSPQPKQPPPKFVIPNENNNGYPNNNNNNNPNNNDNPNNSRSAPTPPAPKAKFVIPSETAALNVMDDAVQVSLCLAHATI